MAQLRIMSSRGDKTVTWDAEKIDLGDPEAVAAVREAERIFNEERARGATAFKVDPGKPAERLDNFDKTVEQTVIVPRIAGG